MSQCDDRMLCVAEDELVRFLDDLHAESARLGRDDIEQPSSGPLLGYVMGVDMSRGVGSDYSAVVTWETGWTLRSVDLYDPASIARTSPPDFDAQARLLAGPPAHAEGRYLCEFCWDRMTDQSLPAAKSPTGIAMAWCGCRSKEGGDVS